MLLALSLRERRQPPPRLRLGLQPRLSLRLRLGRGARSLQERILAGELVADQDPCLVLLGKRGAEPLELRAAPANARASAPLRELVAGANSAWDAQCGDGKRRAQQRQRSDAGHCRCE